MASTYTGGAGVCWVPRIASAVRITTASERVAVVMTGWGEDGGGGSGGGRKGSPGRSPRTRAVKGSGVA